MKRNWLTPYLGGSAALTFSIAVIPVPGCEVFRNDPAAFIAENTCNLFNCNTLFFLEGGHDEPQPEPDADHDESETVDVG